MTSQIPPRTPITDFLTENKQMHGLLHMMEKIAPTNVTCLIQGESGTGKELIARRVHELSKRAERPMVSINCGAIHESLLLSELFGHEKGAFTGAVQQKAGLVEQANGGTLFLDEIGEMGMEAQAKLLRFLQEGEVQRVGGKAPIQVDVRIVSATNKDLESHVNQQKFREDLFYRINTVTVRVLPLRKRPEDIPILVEHFLGEGSPLQGSPKRVSTKAMEILRDYSWPGNVRELQNTMERFKILVDDDLITEADIPFNIKNEGIEPDYFDGMSTFLLDSVEKRHILRVLEHFKGNKTQAANAMGITVKTLYNKLARYHKEKKRSLNSDERRPSQYN